MVKIPKITLSIDFIDQLQTYEDIKWEDIIQMIERMDNRLTEATSIGHVFHLQDTNEPVFIEFYFELRPGNEYLVDFMETISCDRYLDLILENRKVKLRENQLRWVH